jgi:hypothetical protein
MKPAVLEANMKTEESIRSAVSPDRGRGGSSPAEQELLREVALAADHSLRIRRLMVHDGRVVELNKTARIFKNAT